MSKEKAHTWIETNQQYLLEALAAIRGKLELAAQRRRAVRKSKAVLQGQSEIRCKRVAASMPAPPSLEILCSTFALSPFERDTLLLCAGIELDCKFAELCAAAQGAPARAYPTWSLALATLAEPHWSALAPAGPLRRWRLIELGGGSTITGCPLRIDERVLHFLAGVSHMDERLAGIIEPLRTEPGELADSQRVLAAQIAQVWSEHRDAGRLPVIQLLGAENAAKKALAAEACAAIGLNVNVMHAAAVPSTAGELEAMERLLEREAALSSSALLLDCDELDSIDTTRENQIGRLIESLHGVLIITGRERRLVSQRTLMAFEARKPTSNEQRAIWQAELGDVAGKLNGHIDEIVSQFDLNVCSIRSACAAARPGKSSPLASLQAALWDCCRAQARPRLDDLAQQIHSAATWDDLVLPEPQIQILREIAMHVRQRIQVYENWGFGRKCSRGLGISALFAGPSGTGKTMTAEVLANELRLDLYRIDLSQVVSKYIGETEKNLRRVFDAAEKSCAILLFDEADALFGKRSEVKDSHDRYANIEVSYLLQRMEAYRGLAILTTNLKTALDPAFQRRLRFIVQFPFPDASLRARIWERIFPRATPTKNLDANQLARLNVAGGNIRNIALNAAFLAAEANQPVKMDHLLRSARSEYAKLEKSLTEAETGGWT